MDILNELEIEFVVAPYEADAQMAYMVQSGMADFAISEDSDLIAYGCPKIVMKLMPGGQCEQFSFEDFYKSKCDCKDIKILQGLDKREFVLACVMAGCEYVENIERVGLKVALKHFEKSKTFEQVMLSLMKSPNYKRRIPEDYVNKAVQAAQLFMY